MSTNPNIPHEDSLIERAAKVYDFGAALRRGAARESTIAPHEEEGRPSTRSGYSDSGSNASQPEQAERVEAPSFFPVVGGPIQPIDRARLAEAGFIVPDAPPGKLAEEFRLVKRQLLLAASGGQGGEPLPHGRMILVASAQANEGKTFCAVNLALSLASERDTEVLLIDADVAKPEILSTLGLAGGPGLMDALADPSIDVESLVIRTDIAKLSVLGAGVATRDDTELLASARTRAVLAAIEAHNPNRIVIFDSAPALAASPASVLALNVGQVMMVVRADRTTEEELRDAVKLVEGCPRVSLLLNGATYFASHRKFGSYYGQGE